MKVYAIVQDVTGPAGHGEPGLEYVALALSDNRYTPGQPYPICRNREDAEILLKPHNGWYRIMELELQ